VAVGERQEARVATVGDDRLEARQRRVLGVELLLEEPAGRLGIAPRPAPVPISSPCPPKA
jgi:hypothetical protein